MDRFEANPPFDPDDLSIPLEALAAVPATVAREDNVLPLTLLGGVLTVAVVRPNDFELIDKLRFILGGRVRQIETVPAPAKALRAAIARHYGGAGA